MVINFINHSAKRVDLLETMIDEHVTGDSKKRRLKTFCATRWVQRHESVLTFHEMMPALTAFLEECENSSDRETSCKARLLHKTICDPSFVVTLCILKDVLAITVNLSIFLQNVNNDLYHAVSYIENVTKVLVSRRSRLNESFVKTWEEAKVLAEKLGIELTKPRVVKKQVHRENIPSSSAEEHYRRAVYTQFLDHVHSQMKQRFEQHNAVALKIGALIPEVCVSLPSTALQPLLDAYGKFIDKNKVNTEYEIWQQTWKSSDDKPKSIITALEKCEKKIFPNIHTLLRICATLPITTASGERSFSTLKRLKTYLRSTMSKDRLSSLALINVHKEI